MTEYEEDTFNRANFEEFNKENKGLIEIFLDDSYYGLWCVRDSTDRRFDSSTSFHFFEEQDAREFKRLLEISQ